MGFPLFLLYFRDKKPKHLLGFYLGLMMTLSLIGVRFTLL